MTMAGREVCLSKLEVGGSRQLYLLTTWHHAGEDGLDLALSDGIQAWTGTLNEDDLEKLSRKVKMDFDTFLQQTRKALTRRSVGSLNFLYETKVAAAGFQLMWKKHLADEDIRVNLGVVMLKECADASVVTRLIFEHAISISSDLQGKIGQLESENERLATERASALKRLEKCVAAKEDMERDLYAKFATVVNDKKCKIRSLKEEVAHLEENGVGPSSSGAVSPSAAAKTETSDVESEPEMAEVKDEPHSSPLFGEAEGFTSDHMITDVKHEQDFSDLGLDIWPVQFTVNLFRSDAPSELHFPSLELTEMDVGLDDLDIKFEKKDIIASSLEDAVQELSDLNSSYEAEDGLLPGAQFPCAVPAQGNLAPGCEPSAALCTAADGDHTAFIPVITSVESVEEKSEQPIRYECSVCTKSYSTHGSLRRHMEVHGNSFQCNVCGEEFVNRRRLESHQKRIHEEREKFPCNMCNAVLSSKYSLRLHLLIHTKDYNFFCDICGKGFVMNREYAAHCAKHQNIRPYPCTVCDKAFFSPNALWRHKEESCGVSKSILCPICGVKFKARRYLAEHLKIHQGQNYMCDICGKSYSFRASLYRHMLKAHNAKL